MAEMRHPALGSVINVREDAVKRYAEAGYVEVKSSDTKSTPTKRASSRTTKK